MGLWPRPDSKEGETHLFPLCCSCWDFFVFGGVFWMGGGGGVGTNRREKSDVLF